MFTIELQVTMLTTLLLCATSALALPTILTNDTFGGPHIPGQIPTNPKEPLQQRTAYVNSTAMHVSWNTYAQLNDTEAVVEYGITPLSLNETGMAQSSTYPTARTWSHHALLTGLTPSTTYWYRVAHTNCLGCSEIPTYRFTTAREPGDMSPYTLAMVADLGTMGPDGLTTYGGPDLASGNHTVLKDGQSNTIQSLLQELDTYDAVVHAGDLVYADYFIKASVAGLWGNGSVKVNQTSVDTAYQTITEEFYDQMQPITAMRPYMVAPGNHDSNCDNGGTTDKKNNITYDVTICMEGQTNFTGYRNHWRMPGYVTDGEENFWYSYDDGMVHYVFFNTETDFGNNVTAPDEPTAKSLGLDSGPFGMANEQISWLQNDLSSVDRSKTPWVVAVGHRPWYVSKNDTLCPTCQTTFEPLFIQHNVDLVLQGHVHVYSRSLPVANGTVDSNSMNDPKSPIYIVNGAGGHYDGLDTLDPPTNYTAFQEDSAYGWSKFIFHNRTHVTTQFVASANGTVLDEATLYKSHA